MLRFAGVTKRYPANPWLPAHDPGGPAAWGHRGDQRPALDGLDLEVRNGEIVGLVGLNGAGKTTAIRIAVGVSLPTRGSVSVDGHDIVEEKIEAASTLGWVPEFPNFEPQAGALELLQYFAGYHGMGGAPTREWCISLLQQVGLEGRERDRVGTFSQGMKKRFAMAAALLNRPKNLFLDELLNGLDPQGIRFSRNLLLSLRQQGCAILLSSHILTEVEQLSDRIAFVHQGKLIKTISHDELEKAPGSRLRIRITAPDQGALEYLRSVGPTETDGPTFVLAAPQADPAEVNAQLVRRGYRVVDLHTEREDLEAYFFRLIGEDT